MCQRNWRQYNASLVQRGSLSFFCDPKTLSLLRKSQESRSYRRKGGRPPYPFQLILLLTLLKISYGLTYRSCEGMALSLLVPHGIRVPSYSTICRGMRRLVTTLPALSRRRPKNLLIDASGFKVLGEGEWKTRVHGRSYQRSWIKVHLIVDSASNEIIDLIVTPSSEGDVTVGIQFLNSLPASADKIFADGAYDGKRFRCLAIARGVEAVVPPPTNAKLSHLPQLASRNEAIRLIRGLGGGRLARQIWGKIIGYRHRVKVESAFARLKKLFGGGVFSRNKIAQAVELWLYQF